MILLIYLGLGAVAGLTAGLFGVGGGIVIVPALVITFTALGVAPAILMQLAVGTSLATIVVTGLSSVRSHHKAGNVDWTIWRLMTPGLIVGVWFGVNTAAALPGEYLKIGFGCFAVFVALQMGFGLKPAGAGRVPGGVGLTVVGAVFGYLSALFGIGGGSLTVPYLDWCRQRVQVAVAVAAACGVPIAIAGALSNIFVGWEHPDLPAHSLGYVYLPAFAGIVISSSVFAGVGARMAQRLPAPVLRKSFAGFLMLMAVWLIFSR